MTPHSHDFFHQENWEHVWVSGFSSQTGCYPRNPLLSYLTPLVLRWSRVVGRSWAYTSQGSEFITGMLQTASCSSLIHRSCQKAHLWETTNNVNRKHYPNTAPPHFAKEPFQIIYVHFNQGHLEIILHIYLYYFAPQFLNGHPRTSAKLIVSESF